MNFKSASLLACGLLLSVANTAWAQLAVEDLDWKETEVPSPPAFDVGRLVTFEVSPNSSLAYGVDPAAISISKRDNLARYVMVATSSSGARNVMYEGLRCSTGEFKTYARYSPDGRWDMVSNPEWRSLFGNMPSKQTLRFAKADSCDNAAPVMSVNELVSRLKNPNFKITQ